MRYPLRGCTCSGDWMTAGAGYLSCSSGKVHFEVEVCSASGGVFVGVAGTNFRSGLIGDCETSWGIYIDGDTKHRQATDCLQYVLHSERIEYLLTSHSMLNSCSLLLTLYKPPLLAAEISGARMLPKAGTRRAKRWGSR
jgi:hypothetical protein